MPGATSDADYAAGVATDGEGNVYISGNTHTFCGDVGCEGYAWLAKYSAAGVPLWKQNLAISGWDAARDVATDRNGNSYIVGTGLCDGWMAKYSAAGALLWKGKLGSRNDVRGSGVATDNKGSVYISGFTQTPCVCINPVCGVFEYHAWLFKCSAAGALLWQRQLGTPGGDYAADVATDDKGNAYMDLRLARRRGEREVFFGRHPALETTTGSACARRGCRDRPPRGHRHRWTSRWNRRGVCRRVDREILSSRGLGLALGTATGDFGIGLRPRCRDR